MRVVTGILLLAVGATLMAGGVAWPEGRITAIAWWAWGTGETVAAAGAAAAAVASATYSAVSLRS